MHSSSQTEGNEDSGTSTSESELHVRFNSDIDQGDEAHYSNVDSSSKRKRWRRTMEANRRAQLSKMSLADQVGSDLNQVSMTVLPRVRLETLQNTSLCMLFLFNFLVFALALATLSWYYSTDGFFKDMSAGTAGQPVPLAGLEERWSEYLIALIIPITPTFVILIFLFFTFPIRILALTCNRKTLKELLPQQITMAIMIVFNVLIPEYSVIGIGQAYQAFYESRNSNITEKIVEELEDDGVLLDPSSVGNSNTLLMIYITVLFLQMLVKTSQLYTEGLEHKLEEKEREKDLEESRASSITCYRMQPTSQYSNLFGEERSIDEADKHGSSLSKVSSVGEAEEGVAGPKEDAPSRIKGVRNRFVYFKGRMEVLGVNMMTTMETETKRRKFGNRRIGFCSCYYLCLCFICCNYKSCASKTSLRGVIRRSVDWRFFWYIFFYLVMAGILTAAFGFQTSVIPLTSPITVLRICFTKDEAGSYLCSPKAHRVGFQRAMSCIFLACWELLIVLRFHTVIKESKKSLGKVPYSVNRANYLGFGYTICCVLLFTFFCTILSLVETFANEKAVYIYKLVIVPGNSTSDLVLETQLDPLFQVGVTSTSVAFAGITSCLSALLFSIADGYLPADISGLKGWFGYWKPCCSSSRCSGCRKRYEPHHQLSKANKMAVKKLVKSTHSEGSASATSVSTNYDEDVLERFLVDNPLFLVEERHFEALYCEQHEGELNRLRGVLQKSSRNLSNVSLKDENVLCNQARAHVLVLETEILLFNFANLIYKMGTVAKPLTFQQEQSLFDDAPSFQLVKHVIDTPSDTHCIVVISADRVIVSFRGTVSKVNVKTDLDYGLVEFEQGLDVEPLIYDEEIQRVVQNTYANKAPKVHGGFLKAYNQVRDELWDIVKPLVIPEGAQTRALFFTGHSLGGGLSVIAAFDFARRITQNFALPPAISCTTWACPRVGNYSFCRRFARLIPNAKRWVLASDMIPKTPPRLFKHTYQGYHHVGTELLLDLTGNLIVSPTYIELLVLHGARSLNSKVHFCSRYCLALVLWCARIHVDPNFLIIILNSMIKFAAADIVAVDQSLVRKAYGVFFRDGVEFIWDKRHYRTSACQADEQTFQEVEILIDQADNAAALSLGEESDALIPGDESEALIPGDESDALIPGDESDDENSQGTIHDPEEVGQELPIEENLVSATASQPSKNAFDDLEASIVGALQRGGQLDKTQLETILSLVKDIQNQQEDII